MRRRSEETLEYIFGYIEEYYRRNHAAPTVRQIATEVQIAVGTAYNYLVEMERRGMLSYRDGEISGMENMSKVSGDLISVPLVGSITCGDPENETEEVEKYYDLPAGLFGKGEFYLLRATGDSMEDDGIYDGDVVLIEQQKECNIGDIVVALDDENQNTLKRYGGIDKKSKKVVLEYSNEAVYPGKKIYVDFLQIQGVARRVIHEL